MCGCQCRGKPVAAPLMPCMCGACLKAMPNPMPNAAAAQSHDIPVCTVAVRPNACQTGLPHTPWHVAACHWTSQEPTQGSKNTWPHMAVCSCTCMAQAMSTPVQPSSVLCRHHKNQPPWLHLLEPNNAPLRCTMLRNSFGLPCRSPCRLMSLTISRCLLQADARCHLHLPQPLLCRS